MNQYTQDVYSYVSIAQNGKGMGTNAILKNQFITIYKLGVHIGAFQSDVDFSTDFKTGGIKIGIMDDQIINITGHGLFSSTPSKCQLNGNSLDIHSDDFLINIAF